MNICEEYTEFKKLRSIYRRQNFFMSMFFVFILLTILFAVFEFPIILTFITINSSFISFITVLIQIVKHVKYITYREYRKHHRRIYKYVEGLLNNESDLDNEMLVLLTDPKKFK